MNDEKQPTPDEIFGVKTGWFHYSKQFIGAAISPFIPKLQKGIDSTYGKTQSKNVELFKEIISDLEFFDRDSGESTGRIAGLTRKAFYILIAKFFVCLYEYDLLYSERIDFVLRRLFEQGDRIYLDEQSRPQNWYPNRNVGMMTMHMLQRRKGFQ